MCYTAARVQTIGAPYKTAQSYHSANEGAAEEDKIYCYIVLSNNNDNTLYSNLMGRFPIESYYVKTRLLLLTSINSMLSL